MSTRWLLAAMAGLLAGCASDGGLRAANTDGLGPRANIPPLSAGSCTLSGIDTCVVVIRPTIGEHPSRPGSKCYVDFSGVQPGALLVQHPPLANPDAKVLWRIDTQGLSGDFAFAQATAVHDGGITIYKAGSDFTTPEPESNLGIDPQTRKVRVKPLTSSKGKAHHYDIRLIFQAPSTTRWEPCLVLDPVIVNRG